jgi:hypothetical protein
MPYYIYQIKDPRSLQYLDHKDQYQDAKAVARSLRGDLAATDAAKIRMVFARSASEAEKLLSAPRDNRVIGED